MSAVSYSDQGHDFNNQPPHRIPTYLSERGQKIYGIIQSNLVEQARVDKGGNGYVAFVMDSEAMVVDTTISVLKLTEAIEAALSQEER